MPRSQWGGGLKTREWTTRVISVERVSVRSTSPRGILRGVSTVWWHHVRLVPCGHARFRESYALPVAELDAGCPVCRG